MSKILGPFGILFKDESKDKSSNSFFSLWSKSKSEEKHPLGKLYCCYFYFDEAAGWSMKKTRLKNNTSIPDSDSALLKLHAEPLPAKLPVLYASNFKGSMSSYCFVFDAHRIHALKAMYDDLSTERYDGIQHEWTYDPQSTEHHVKTIPALETFKITQSDVIEANNSPRFDFSPKETFEAWQDKKIETLSEPDRIRNIIAVRQNRSFEHETLKDDIAYLKANSTMLQTVAQIYFSNNLNALNNFLNILTILVDARPTNPKSLSQEQIAELWKYIRTRDDISWMFLDFLVPTSQYFSRHYMLNPVNLSIPIKQVAPFVAYEPKKQRLRKLYDFGAHREPSELTEILNTISDEEIFRMISDDENIEDRHRELPQFSVHLPSTHNELTAWVLSKLPLERRAIIQEAFDEEDSLIDAKPMGTGRSSDTLFGQSSSEVLHDFKPNLETDEEKMDEENLPCYTYSAQG